MTTWKPRVVCGLNIAVKRRFFEFDVSQWPNLELPRKSNSLFMHFFCLPVAIPLKQNLACNRAKPYCGT